MKRKIGIAMLTLVASGVLAGGIYLVWLRLPPKMPANVQEAMALMNSPQYRRLSEQERQPYLERMRQLGESLTAEERKALWEKGRNDPEFRKNAREAQSNVMLQRAREFAQADSVTRRNILDKIIAMQEMAPRGGGGNPGPRPGNDANRQERQKWFQDRIEHGNPQAQAYMSEFFKALIERRKDLGLSPLPAGPRHAG